MNAFGTRVADIHTRDVDIFIALLEPYAGPADIGDGRLGDYDVTVQVEDGNGNFDTQSYTITVIEYDDYNELFGRDGLVITRTSIGGGDGHYVKPGAELRLNIRAENNGDNDLEDLEIYAIIQDLGLMSNKMGPIDLDDGDKTSRSVYMLIPEYVREGKYDVRITISNDYMKRVKHRELQIIK